MSLTAIWCLLVLAFAPRVALDWAEIARHVQVAVAEMLRPPPVLPFSELPTQVIVRGQ